MAQGMAKFHVLKPLWGLVKVVASRLCMATDWASFVMCLHDAFLDLHALLCTIVFSYAASFHGPKDGCNPWGWATVITSPRVESKCCLHARARLQACYGHVLSCVCKLWWDAVPKPSNLSVDDIRWKNQQWHHDELQNLFKSLHCKLCMQKLSLHPLGLWPWE